MINMFEVSLLSSDLGMDIRDSGAVFDLPKAKFYKVKYDDRKNRQLITQGDWEYVSQILSKAGYKVEQDEEQAEKLFSNNNNDGQ
jgi:hypothetical protein